MNRRLSRPSNSEPAGAPADADEQTELQADLSAQAREVVLRRLSHAPRTRAQLSASLHDHGIPDQVADAVLDQLGEVGLIDDTAFSRAWVEGRSHARGLSRSRLRRELLDRGVDFETADQAVSGLDSDTDEQSARELAERWTRRRPLVDQRDRDRLTGYLLRRGYGPGLAARIARGG